MKRRDIPRIFLLMGTVLLLSLAACKSAPPEAPPPSRTVPPPAPAKAPEGPDRAALDALDAAIRRAEDGRKRAFDFDAPEYFPQDWDSADGRYQSLESGTSRNSAEAVADAAARYDELTLVFEDLFQQSHPLYARDREEEVMEARGEAVDAGAEELLPEFLLQADRKALEALFQYEGEDYYAAVDSAALALDLYRVLKIGAEAYALRLEIEERDLYHYVPEDFDRADELGDAAIAAYRNGDPAEARSFVEEARSGYDQALIAGLDALVIERRDFAAEERRIALELKADVAVRDGFAAADKLYNQAGRYYQEKMYDMAAGLYEEAGGLFIRAQRDTIEKRRLAEDAIRNAEEKMAESDEWARNAELIMEGGAE